jgi:hypothetical protein
VLAGVKIDDDDHTDEEVFEDIDRFIDNMRVRMIENTAIIEGDPPTYGEWTVEDDDGEDDGEDFGEDDGDDDEAGDKEKEAG